MPALGCRRAASRARGRPAREGRAKARTASAAAGKMLWKRFIAGSLSSVLLGGCAGGCLASREDDTLVAGAAERAESGDVEGGGVLHAAADRASLVERPVLRQARDAV